MANGTTTILPSATGGGLTRGVEGFLEARFRKRQQDLEERRVAAQEEQVDIAGRQQALTTLAAVSSMAPGDTPLSELPFLIPLAEAAIPQMAGSDWSQLTPRILDLNQFLDTYVKQGLEDGTIDEDTAQRITNFRLFQAPVTTQELELGSELNIGKMETSVDAMRTLLRTPETLTAIGRGLFNLPETIEFTLPGGEQVMLPHQEWTQMWLGLARLNTEIELARAESEKDRSNILEERRKAALPMLVEMADKLGLTVSPTNVGRMYDALIQGQITGSWDAWHALGQEFVGPGPVFTRANPQSPEDLLMMDMMTESMVTGNEFYINQFRDMPHFQSAMLYTGLGEEFGKIMPIEQVPEALNYFVRANENLGRYGMQLGIQPKGHGVRIGPPRVVVDKEYYGDMKDSLDAAAARAAGAEGEASPGGGGGGAGAGPIDFGKMTIEQAIKALDEGVTAQYLIERGVPTEVVGAAMAQRGIG